MYNAGQLHTIPVYIQWNTITNNSVKLHTMQYNYIRRSKIT